MGHRLFAVDVLAAVDCLKRAEGVPVIGGGDDDCIDAGMAADFTEVAGHDRRRPACRLGDFVAGWLPPQGLALPPLPFTVVHFVRVTDRHDLNVRLDEKLIK